MIAKKEMVEAIKESGYLHEQRVAQIFESLGFSIVPNQIIVDPITNVRREIDLVAMKIDLLKDTNDFFGYEIICECENNKEPIVFFPRHLNKYTYLSELKSTGFELMWELFKSNCEGFPLESISYASQYCSFNYVNSKQENKKKWIANHSDVQHDTFTKLKKSVQHRMDLWKLKTQPFDKIEGRIHFPVLVLNDNLFLWDGTNHSDPLKKIDHIIYVAQDFNETNNNYEYFFIDVISEQKLNELIKYKKDQWSFLKNLILKNRSEIVRKQMDRIGPKLL